MVAELILPAIVILVLIGIFAFWTVRFVRPTNRALLERFGRYHAFYGPGIAIVVPFIDNLVEVNITEQMVNAQQQEVITKDSLNAIVDAQIYFKVRADEESIKKSQYSVNDYTVQIVSLSRTTLRAIIGEMTLTEANSMRNELNTRLGVELSKQVGDWGIEVVRAEVKEIQPPSDVQATMTKVVLAEKEKIAAKDFASATENRADGECRASIQVAEGAKTASILKAEGEANAILKIADAHAKEITIVNTAAAETFKGQAVELRKIEMTERVLASNTKFIVPQGSNLVNVLSEASGMKLLPLNTSASAAGSGSSAMSGASSLSGSSGASRPSVSGTPGYRASGKK